MTLSAVLVGVLASLAVLVLSSYIVEALRRFPKPPDGLAWAPNIPIQYVDIGGARVRCIKTGTGPNLVLLHTLRTQLDIFDNIIPDVAKHFTVYALDYPGHGYSDIPKARYDASFFAEVVDGFLEVFDLRDVTLAGVSIGGAVSLIVAARRNPRVGRVIAINPYDYAKGRGMARSSPLGWIVTYTSLIPVVGETVMRLRNFFIVKAIFRGGVADAKRISPALLKEMYAVGNRRGHYRAFISLLRNAASWETATKDYGRITVPVLLLWGEQDWARPSEREHDRDLIPGAQMATVERGGHFLPFDRPDAVIAHLKTFAFQ